VYGTFELSGNLYPSSHANGHQMGSSRLSLFRESSR
jgi:hypothetical protein